MVGVGGDNVSSHLQREARAGCGVKIRRYLSMVEERHIRLVITLIVVVALGFLVNFFVRENDKAEKRRKEWQVGCKGGLGKAHSGLSTVSVFYSEELLDEYRRQMLLSLTGQCNILSVNSPLSFHPTLLLVPPL